MAVRPGYLLAGKRNAGFLGQPGDGCLELTLGCVHVAPLLVDESGAGTTADPLAIGICRSIADRIDLPGTEGNLFLAGEGSAGRARLLNEVIDAKEELLRRGSLVSASLDTGGSNRAHRHTAKSPRHVLYLFVVHYNRPRPYRAVELQLPHCEQGEMRARTGPIRHQEPARRPRPRVLPSCRLNCDRIVALSTPRPSRTRASLPPVLVAASDPLQPVAVHARPCEQFALCLAKVG
jgi:hypothetical protein